MTDFEAKYKAESDLAAVASQVPGLWDAENQLIRAGGLGPNLAGFAVSDPYQRMVSTGNTITDPDSGETFPEMISDGYRYRLLRWGDAVSAMPLPAGVVPQITPAVTDADGNVTSPEHVVINAGPVTLTSPPPAGCPVGFA